MLSPSHRTNDRDEAAPQTLNRFRLLGQIAKGGMAEVFLARAEGLGGFERLLVIKRILPELASDADFVRMFLDEARIAATLHHANIVQVYEVDIADGQVFYAMEHLHGQTVAAMLRQLAERAGQMPLGNAIAITAAVAAGLHYAHERRTGDGQPLSIVHRDVAPTNVIVTYDGNVKLIDFGIAKAVNNLSRTQFGIFKGKLPYASPEQSRCEPVDRRSDVFSLGVMLYELTVGERPFTADNEYDLLRVVSEAAVPRPRQRDSNYPRDLEAIVLKALAADPAQRYPTARALQNDLEVFAGQLHLDLSTLSLARLLEGLFRDEVVRWRDAERAGMTLAQHITRSLAVHGTPLPGVDSSSPGAPRDAAAGEPPAPSRVADAPGSAVAPAHWQRWRKSWIVRYMVRSVALGVAIGGLISLGALGALWWSEPLPIPQRSELPSRPVAPAAQIPAPTVTAIPTPPDMSIAVRSAAATDAGAIRPVVQAADPAPPHAADAPATEPTVERAVAPAALDRSAGREPAAPPPRRPKRSRSRAPHARGAATTEAKTPAPPAEPARALDDATLDEVAPRSTRSR